MKPEPIMAQIGLCDDKGLGACYRECCQEYRRRLNEMWGFDIKDSWWIPTDRVGCVLAICDLECSLAMEDVRLMVDLAVGYDEFAKWWEHCLGADNPINAYNWFVKGCRPKDANAKID